MKKVFLTTGDVDGIGLEVSAKALNQIGPQRGVNFIIMRSPHQSSRWMKLIKTKFQVVPWHDNIKNLDFHKFNSHQLIDICSEDSPVSWFHDSAKYCFKNKNTAALVTGPISKPLFLQSGWNVTGHTGLLKKICRTEPLFMAFLGAHFNVVLATDHIPLKRVSKTLSVELMNQVINLCHRLRTSMTKKNRTLPIGVLGLNPHSGDNGIIGEEECSWLKPWVKSQQKRDLNILGPLVPDAAFQKKFWTQYSMYLALYHDQGLVPFKSIHGQDSGVHLTLGLPFIRTSVDHGTGKDIFNKNRANSSSMKEAILYAVKELRRRI